jgi:hypothetical protein
MKTRKEIQMEIAMKKAYLKEKHGMLDSHFDTNLPPEFENHLLDSIIDFEHQMQSNPDQTPKFVFHFLERK